VAPGASVTVEGTVPEPSQDGYQLRLDLVAEMVAWFSDLGHSKPVVLRGSDL